MSREPDEFAAAVLDLIERRPTTVVVPSTDASIAALRPRRTLIEQRSALVLAWEPTLDLANDKARTLALAAQVGIRTPRSVTVEAPDQVLGALAEVGLPAVLKPTRSWVCARDVGSRVVPRDVINVAEVTAICAEIFGQAVLQSWFRSSCRAVGRRCACSMRTGGRGREPPRPR